VAEKFETIASARRCRASRLTNRVVDKKRKIGKTVGQGGGDAQGVADPQKISFGRNFRALVFADFSLRKTLFCRKFMN
jgi:hypothetical protein